MKYLIYLSATAALLQFKTIRAAVAFVDCGDQPCKEELPESCDYYENHANRFEGNCCSLAPSYKGDTCILTVSNGHCSMTDSDPYLSYDCDIGNGTTIEFTCLDKPGVGCIDEDGTVYDVMAICKGGFGAVPAWTTISYVTSSTEPCPGTTSSTRQCPEGGDEQQSCIYEQCGCAEDSERKSFPKGDGNCFYCAIPDYSSEQCYWDDQCKSESYCNDGSCEPNSTRQCPEGGNENQSCIYEQCGCPENSEQKFFPTGEGDCFYCVIPDNSPEQCYWDGQCKSESYCNDGTCKPNSARQCPKGGNNNQSCIYEECECDAVDSERKGFSFLEGDCYYCAIPDNSTERCYWSGQCKSDSYCNRGSCEPKN